MTYSRNNERICVAGNRSVVGGAVLRRLATDRCEAIEAENEVVDMVDQALIKAWIATDRPDAIMLAATKIDGTRPNNDFPADVFRQAQRYEVLRTSPRREPVKIAKGQAKEDCE